MDVATALLTGGLDTVVSLFAMMMRHLAGEDALAPQTRRRSGIVAGGGARDDTALRHHDQGATGARGPALVDGVTLKAGDMVVMPPLHGLDPTIFPDPLRVDLDRHFCPPFRIW